ncbi:uncharacterized protein LOC135102801 [Scylla paramamosain]|uniref:uncharacterized protein LOC135102801 n=1 Tax=Scylla paramamosain TaxID=85552 RepID=UPI003082723D
MASPSTDTDVGPPTEEELPQAGGRAPGEEASEQEDPMEEGKGGSPGAGLQAKRPHATVKERTVEVRETWSENVHGLDNLTLAINSLDDHVQAGLQEVRNCVGILRHEKNELLKQVRSLSEVVRETSIQRDRYKEATVQLQQEVANLRKQLEAQKKDKDMLSRRMQELEDQDEQHLENIARTMRSKRLAHSTLVKWRKKVHERSGSKALQLQVLEEENSRLRSELLLCQEAAKQAFLRSANALNSEAITMFQDAATRRLGGDEEDDGERPPSPESSSTSSSSSSAHPHNTQDKDSFAGGGGGGNKENVASKGDRDRGERVHEGWHREEDKVCSSDHFHHASGVPKQSDRNVIYSSTLRGNSRDYRVNHTCSVPSRMHWRREEEDEYEEAIDSGSFSHFVRKPSRSRTGHQEPHFRAPSPPPGGEASGGGAVPKPRLARSDFIPDTLQQEARARLQQLQRQQYLRPELSASSFEPQRKTKRVMSSGSSKKSCSCRLLNLSAPYKCPYCTPIHNSDFGHYKATKKSVSKAAKDKGGVSNVVNSTTTKIDNKGADKKVIYNPNACTVLIEKHINK